MKSKIHIILTFLGIIIAQESFTQIRVDETLYSASDYLSAENWDLKARWNSFSSDSSNLELSSFNGYGDDGLKLNFQLKKHPNSSAWAVISHGSIQGFNENTPIVFLIKASADTDIEFKFIDTDGSVFLKRYSLKNIYKEWTQIVVYLKNTYYGWGGNASFDKISNFEIAFSCEDQGSGTVWIDEIGLGKEGILRGFYLDPYRDASGTGFYQRRSESILPEDNLVLEYLKVIQDNSSPESKLLPNQDEDIYVSTFNNSLAAMAYIVKDEKERAERILDFYSEAVNVNNTDIAAQSFYYNGEARGFYQHININTYKRPGNSEDRWIGDMAWLAVAYKQYEKVYGKTPQYENVVNAIGDLLISNYKEQENDCGCIQTGWQDGDQLFDTGCHHEGNISCYAALMALGKTETAEKVKKWLHENLNFENPPLDLYTWQVLAFEEKADSILMHPEYDFQYRKKLHIGTDSIYGIYSFANIEVNNTWTEGIGHMACAQFTAEDELRGNFYANQFDPMLIQYNLFGSNVKTLPYALNTSGDYPWINNTIGSVSSSSWYIFAKNRFNPLHTGFPDRVEDLSENSDCLIYPNPAEGIITVEGEYSDNIISIFSNDGRIVMKKVLHGKYNEIDLGDFINGIYFIKVENSKGFIIKKLIKQ